MGLSYERCPTWVWRRDSGHVTPDPDSGRVLGHWSVMHLGSVLEGLMPATYLPRPEPAALGRGRSNRIVDIPGGCSVPL
jgi:hypothetical protein